MACVTGYATGKRTNATGKRRNRASLDKFGQVWASLGKFRQVWASLGEFGGEGGGGESRV